MASSPERLQCVPAVAASCWRSEAPHHQSATKLAFKVETNLMNYSFPTPPFINFTCNLARDSPSALIRLHVIRIRIYQRGRFAFIYTVPTFQPS